VVVRRPAAPVALAWAATLAGLISIVSALTPELADRVDLVRGVLPPGVRDLAGVRTELWPSYQPATPRRRGPFGIIGIGRLRPGVTLQAARTDLRSVSQRIFPIWQSGFTDSAAKLTPVPLRAARQSSCN